MVRYEFEASAFFHQHDKADPQVIGEALAKIAEENKGRMKPEHVTEAAQKRGHPLHRHFIWNDKVAGQRYRLDQARALIRSVKIIAADDINGAAARAYHSIQDDGRAYRSVTEIQTSALLQLSLHQAALRDLVAWEARYKSIAGICSLVSVARERLQEALTTMVPPSAARSRRQPPPPESRPT